MRYERRHEWGVGDNYRYQEALKPSTLEWMKAQSAYTRSLLDSIKPRAALRARIAAFTGGFGVIQDCVSRGGRAFYEERAPGAGDFDLVVSDAVGKRKIVDVAALRAAHGGTPYAINHFFASPDGSKVAVGVSQAGTPSSMSGGAFNTPR